MMKKISKKKEKIKRKYREICKKIGQDLIEEHGYIPCASCGIRVADSGGNPVRSFGFSHNISVGQNLKFELVPGNIQPRCQDWGERRGCHEKLDSGDMNQILQLQDFEDLLEFRRQNAPLMYNLWVGKLKEIGVEYYDYEPT